MKRYVVPALAYLVPTFLLGYVWHLVLFARYYERLAMYRHDVVIPLGLGSMTIQSLFFAWVWERLASSGAPLVSRTWRYALVGAGVSWSFTTLAVAAKNVMTSVGEYIVIESGFTAAQWMLVAMATATVSAARGGSGAEAD
jgi:hypothetical protein